MVRDGLLSWKIISITQDLIDLKERLGIAVKSSQNAGARMESDELQSSRADSLARGGPGSPGLSTSCLISLAIRRGDYNNLIKKRPWERGCNFWWLEILNLANKNFWSLITFTEGLSSQCCSAKLLGPSLVKIWPQRYLNKHLWLNFTIWTLSFKTDERRVGKRNGRELVAAKVKRVRA